MHSTAATASPLYTILISAIDAYCARTSTARPRTDAARAMLLGISTTVVSRIKHDRYPMNWSMAQTIAKKLGADEEEQQVLSTQLLEKHAEEAPNRPVAPEVSFVRKFGVAGSVLLVEITDVWPHSYGFETPTSPMSLAFKEGMDAGMNVILLVPYRIRTLDGKPEQSMGDGFTDHAARSTFIRLQRLNADRVALYHVVENPCPTPRSGLRLTGLLPREGPETRWWIAHRPNEWHLIPTNQGPDEFLDFFLGTGVIRNGGVLPTQGELEHTWHNLWRSQKIPADRPCPSPAGSSNNNARHAVHERRGTNAPRLERAAGRYAFFANIRHVSPQTDLTGVIILDNLRSRSPKERPISLL